MGISTSTGTLTAGQSRTFNLAPASAVTLTLLPNVRVTITESPAAVTATGLGGNATRVHEPRLPGSFTYGPYPMGGAVVVENESNSGSTVTWVRSDALIAESVDGTASLVDGAGNAFLRGALTSGEWVTIPSIFRLRLTGTGTVVMDSRDSLGGVALAVESYSPSGATDQIEFPYAGDNAVAIRVTLTGTATAEVI